MQYRIERLSIDDYEECLHFLKTSFNEYAHLVDFDKELPKAFRPKQELMEQNYVIRNERRILSLVGIYPMDLCVNTQKIHCATVGNVATHPDERGKGYMKALFAEAIAEVDRKGIDMTRLGGLRQRYNRYGYEYAGMCVHYVFTKRNAAAYRQVNTCTELNFVPLDESSGDLLRAAFTLYQRKSCHVDRLDEETFLCVLRAHYMQPWAVIDQDGKFFGYITASADCKKINEQYSASALKTIDIDVQWLEKQNIPEVMINLNAWDCENRMLSSYAEKSMFLYPSLFRITNWKHVIQTFLQYKNDNERLPDGRVTIAIENEGTYLLNIGNGCPSCSQTDEKPDITVDHLTATRLMFGILPPILTANTDFDTLEKLSKWLPLPLSWTCQDNV